MAAVRGSGRELSARHKKNIARARRGTKHSEETKRKIALSVRAANDFPVRRQFSASHLAKLRKARRERTGGKLSWATRLKIKRALQGRKLSAETKEKIRQARTGSGKKQKREAANLKLSASMKAAWVLRRAREAGGGQVPPWLAETPEVRAAYDALRGRP